MWTTCLKLKFDKWPWPRTARDLLEVSGARLGGQCITRCGRGVGVTAPVVGIPVPSLARSLDVTVSIENGCDKAHARTYIWGLLAWNVDYLEKKTRHFCIYDVYI